MTRPLVVLRPEPGNARTAAVIESLGHRAIRLPLFAVAPVAWTPPPGRFDALMLTSANAVRHGGPGLKALHALPIVAVGASTAAAARAAGLDVALIGDSDATRLAAAAHERGFASLLHLAGRDRVPVPGVAAVTVYTSEPLPIEPTSLLGCRNAVVLLHSIRAARRFCALAEEAGIERRQVRLAGLSAAVVAAAGIGWEATLAAPRPTDPALVDAGVALAD